MKFIRFFGLAALVVLAATVAKADGIDPTVIIRQVDPPPIAITNPNAPIPILATADQNIVAVQNDTNQLITFLSLTLTGSINLDFNFGEDPGDGIFTSFTKTVNGNLTTLTFFGVDGSHTGLLASDCSNANPTEFTFCQQCVGPVYEIEFDGIPVDAVVFGFGRVGVPEPATALLLAGGIAGLAAFRRRRPSLQN